MSCKTLFLASLAALLAGQALAADLSPSERRRLDRQVFEEQRGYVEKTTPYFAAPPSYYARRGTARICVDDADGVTCSYKNFPLR